MCTVDKQQCHQLLLLGTGKRAKGLTAAGFTCIWYDKLQRHEVMSFKKETASLTRGKEGTQDAQGLESTEAKGETCPYLYQLWPLGNSELGWHLRHLADVFESSCGSDWLHWN